MICALRAPKWAVVGTAWGESNGANLALAARVYRCPVDFIASAWAIVAAFSAIIGALNKALIRSFSTSGGQGDRLQDERST